MAQTDPGFGFGPGAGREFHPLGLAISFFFMWAITGMGQPSTLVRLMAFRDSKTLRYSIIYLTIYNALIYIPLIFIFVAARSILPNLASSDDVMPSLVIKLANPYVAGLILAAPVWGRAEHRERLALDRVVGAGTRYLPAASSARPRPNGRLPGPAIRPPSGSACSSPSWRSIPRSIFN